MFFRRCLDTVETDILAKVREGVGVRMFSGSVGGVCFPSI